MFRCSAVSSRAHAASVFSSILGLSHDAKMAAVAPGIIAMFMLGRKWK